MVIKDSKSAVKRRRRLAPPPKCSKNPGDVLYRPLAAPALGYLDAGEGAGKGNFGSHLGFCAGGSRGGLSFFGTAAGFLGAGEVDFIRMLGGIGQDNNPVGTDLHKAPGHSQIQLAAVLFDGKHARLEHGHKRRVLRQDTKLAVYTGRDNLIHVLRIDSPLGSYDFQSDFWHYSSSFELWVLSFE
jgi:hypothetical protein